MDDASLNPANATALRRRRPRDYEEWKALVGWGRLPRWEPSAPGYALRRARESAGITQVELARRLGVSQQAVARAERWAEALGGRLDIEIRLRDCNEVERERRRLRPKPVAETSRTSG